MAWPSALCQYVMRVDSKLAAEVCQRLQHIIPAGSEVVSANVLFRFKIHMKGNCMQEGGTVCRSAVSQ